MITNENISYLSRLSDLVTALYQQKIVAYPTESVFGLGCDPDSESAVQSLLKLKKRSWKKGLILVAAHYGQLMSYIDNDLLDNESRKRMLSCWPGPITWIVPALPSTPYWLKGKYTSIAVRVSAFKPIQHLCLTFGKALISTSANLTGELPARTVIEVQKKIGSTFPILEEAVEGRKNPSEIRDALSGAIVRQG